MFKTLLMLAIILIVILFKSPTIYFWLGYLFKQISLHEYYRIAKIIFNLTVVIGCLRYLIKHHIKPIVDKMRSNLK